MPDCLKLSTVVDEVIGPPPLSARIFYQFDKDESGDIDVSELQEIAYHFGMVMR